MPSNALYSPVALQVGVLDVHAGDVVGQQHDFIAVQFVGVFVGERGRFDVLHDADDEVAGADEGVEDVDAVVAEGSAEFGLQDFFDAGTMKSTIGCGV